MDGSAAVAAALSFFFFFAFLDCPMPSITFGSSMAKGFVTLAIVSATLCPRLPPPTATYPLASDSLPASVSPGKMPDRVAHFGKSTRIHRASSHNCKPSTPVPLAPCCLKPSRTVLPGRRRSGGVLRWPKP